MSPVWTIPSPAVAFPRGSCPLYLISKKLPLCFFVSFSIVLILILHNEWGQGVHGNYINGFSEKNSDLGQMDHFRPNSAHNFGFALRIFFKFCIMKEAKR